MEETDHPSTLRAAPGEVRMSLIANTTCISRHIGQGFPGRPVCGRRLGASVSKRDPCRNTHHTSMSPSHLESIHPVYATRRSLDQSVRSSLLDRDRLLLHPSESRSSFTQGSHIGNARRSAVVYPVHVQKSSRISARWSSRRATRSHSSDIRSSIRRVRGHLLPMARA